MDSFATAADLEARWRPLDDAEKARATVLLEDASELLASRWPSLVGNGQAARAAMIVVCAMVRRAMAAADEDAGASSTTASEAALGFSHSMTRQLSNPDGALYISSSDVSSIEMALGRGRGAVSMTMIGA